VFFAAEIKRRQDGRTFALAGLGKNGAAMDEFEVSIKLSPENAWVYP